MKKIKSSYKISKLLYDKKNWKLWLIVYGGIALIFYSSLYIFGGIAKKAKDPLFSPQDTVKTPVVEKATPTY